MTSLSMLLLYANICLFALATFSKYFATLWEVGKQQNQFDKEQEFLDTYPWRQRQDVRPLAITSQFASSSDLKSFCPECRYGLGKITCRERAQDVAERYKRGDMAAAIEHVLTKSAPYCRQRPYLGFQSHQVCFVTSEFSSDLNDADTLPVPTLDMRTEPSRHFVFTNLPALRADGWEMVLFNTSELPYQRAITKSRWPKFLGWKHRRLAHCEVIFYGDAYLMNPANNTLWMEMAQDIKRNPVGLMQDRQEGINGKEAPLKELKKVVREKKLSKKLAEKTIKWLKNQSDFKDDAKVYKNAIFGYDPRNEIVKKLTTDFWDIYSQEELSWRDQPFWAYFLARDSMSPLSLHRKNGPIFGQKGKRGHSGHIYVTETDTEADSKIENNNKELGRAILDHELCFVSSIFADSSDDADAIGDITALRSTYPNLRFFVFTNLEDLPTPGWEKIVEAGLPYKRMITNSRWGKFMSWNTPEIQSCGVVFYSDGHLVPKIQDPAVLGNFRTIAMKVKESKYGLAQKLHPTLKTYRRLIWSVLNYRKDTKENVGKTMDFLRSLPDFREEKAIIYWNQFFAFDPKNEHFRTISSTFWEVYSKEEGAWRDQFLWCYILDKFRVLPFELPERDNLYEVSDARRGFNGHEYVK